MKSAYELAMERLEKESPSGPPLTDKQKAEIAEIQNRYESRIVEKKILAEDARKRAQGDPQALEKIQAELVEDIRRLQAECEEKTNEVRKQKPEK